MSRWDDGQYLKFADERTRAAHELLRRVPLARPRHVVDLGCGPGNSTALLRARFPDAQLVGVDSSAEMLARARRDLPEIPFEQADVAHYAPRTSVDLFFANALMQWVPDHQALLGRLFAQLRPGGALAMQMPCNVEEPSHRLMRTLAGPWQDALAQLHERASIAAPAVYYDLLAPAAAQVDIWKTTYEHVMDGPAAIVEWLKGTGLRPYLEALPEDLRAPYLAAYARAIDEAYPPRSDGKRLFSFPRLFVVALRAP